MEAMKSIPTERLMIETGEIKRGFIVSKKVFESHS